MSSNTKFTLLLDICAANSAGDPVQVPAEPGSSADPATVDKAVGQHRLVTEQRICVPVTVNL
ncbi:MAG: hypothetical protein M5U19_14435, partial [Microthrixaceae bacterium]|nr:hypothetical protein [Microthrixaceae bacterium]